MLRVVYYAWIREAVGMHDEVIDVPSTVHTVEAVVDLLRERGGGYVQAFAVKEKIRAAIDDRLVTLSADLGDASELAFFPPVTGG